MAEGRRHAESMKILYLINFYKVCVCVSEKKRGTDYVFRIVMI